MTINELHTKVNEVYQNNFDTMLGSRMGRMIASLFP